MIKLFNLNNLIGVLITLFSVLGFSKELQKHPRVAELEDQMKNSAMEHIKARFPSVPFMVSVKIDPLRRSFEKPAGADVTNLPYYDAEVADEIQDEWDNTEVSLNALINRVRKIQVSISVPSNINEVEANELKDGVFNILHLTPARDEIKVERKNWVMEEVPWLKIYIISAIVLALLIGLLIINRTSANRIARALGDMKNQNGNSNVSSSGSSASMMPDMASDVSSGQSAKELRINDTFKLKELATQLVQTLKLNKLFPSHQDIFILDKVGQKNSAQLGAILSEFNTEYQRNIFQYSSGTYWIAALNEPGQLDMECIDTLQAMIKLTRDDESFHLSKTVLSVWRMPERTAFLKSLAQEDALALLMEMPKAVAIAEARKVFPGSWASILDPKFKPKKITETESNKIFNAAVATHPAFDLEMIKQYRNEKEILEYLRLSDPTEERDIYGAAPATSIIHKHRQPFFKIFDESAQIQEVLASKVSLDSWSYALFNLPKMERSKIDKYFSEKQMFMMIERFKKFEKNAPDKITVGLTREKIADTCYEIHNSFELKSKVNTDINKAFEGNVS